MCVCHAVCETPPKKSGKTKISLHPSASLTSSYYLCSLSQVISAQVQPAINRTVIDNCLRLLVREFNNDAGGCGHCSDRPQTGASQVAQGCYQPVFQLNGSTRQSETFIGINIPGRKVVAANSFLFVLTTTLSQRYCSHVNMTPGQKTEDLPVPRSNRTQFFVLAAEV